jgi:hypothetical protein
MLAIRQNISQTQRKLTLRLIGNLNYLHCWKIGKINCDKLELKKYSKTKLIKNLNDT